MKKILVLLVLLNLCVVARTPIELSVVGVAPNDVLNVRQHTSHKSHVVATLTPFARGFYTTKALPRDPSSWVSISVKHASSMVRGWVKRRYVTKYGAYRMVRSTRLSLSYPAYMQTNRAKDDSISVSYAIKVNHYDGCDMRDEPEVVRYFSFFGLSFSVHHSLNSALRKPFRDYYKNGKFDASLRYDAQTDWFKMPKQNDWVEAFNFHGKHARRIMTGVEGCGINYYFYRQSGKVVLVSEPYNHNPPVDVKSNKVLSGSWILPNKDSIIAKIVKSLKIR